jgi:hypothetical protein
MSDVKLTVLSEHYRDTQKILENNVKARDQYFFFTLVILAVMAFQLFSPHQSGNVLNEFIKDKLGTETSVSLVYITSILWFSLLAILVRYFQIVINLEKQYNYMHTLEGVLSREYSSKVFTREGKSYLKAYPRFSEWMHIVYRYIFPVLFVIAVTIKITGDWAALKDSVIPQALNGSIYAMIIVSTILYSYSLYKIDKDSYSDIE